MKKFLLWIYRFRWFMLPIGFICGMIGYMILGELPFIESFYATSTLFFISPVSDIDNPYVMACKIIALVATATFIMSAIHSVSNAVHRFWIQRWSDSTAVYTDNESGRQLVHNLKHAYLGRSGISDRLEKTRSHVIMFSDDIQNLKFYQEHYASFNNTDVYIMLNKVNSFLMDRPDLISAKVHFFNLYDLMARMYWQQHHLFDLVRTSKRTIKIAIIGYNQIGEAICKYAFLNNIYDTAQSIEYHIWGCKSYQSKFLLSLNTMNNDAIVIHDDSAFDNTELLEQMDRIIITEEDNIELLQFLLLNLTTPSIHHSFGDKVFEQLFSTTRLTAFGRMDEILNEACIKGESLQRMGKLINLDYSLSRNSDISSDVPRSISHSMERKMEDLWNELDGFHRGSNIARADHYWIEKMSAAAGTPSADLQKLEHTRWCRYYLYNRWTVSTTGSKDIQSRKHPLLVPYEMLSKENQQKDGVAFDCIRKELDRLSNRHAAE